MTDPREAAALIVLLRRGDRPWHHYAQLVEAAGSALDFLEGRYQDPDEPEPLRLFETAGSPTTVDLDEIAREIEGWEAEGMTLVTVLDDDYPANLRSIHNRPPLLFIRGRLTPEDERSVAVVGTRKPSPGGLEAARRMAEGLVPAGCTVVSGLAEGIDAEAHQTVLEVGGRTVAIVGTGLRLTYPAKHSDLQRRIAETGAVERCGRRSIRRAGEFCSRPSAGSTSSRNTRLLRASSGRFFAASRLRHSAATGAGRTRTGSPSPPRARLAT